MARKRSSRSVPKSGPCRITVEQNVTGEYAIELEKRFRSEVEGAKGAVVLDLTAATIIDSRGVALCVGLLRECQKKDFPLTIEVTTELYHRIVQLVEKAG